MISPLSARAIILLSLLPGRMYGQEIIRVVKHKVGIMIGSGSIYPSLEKLQRSRLVTSFLENRAEDEEATFKGGRPRRFYELTAKGREAAGRERQMITNMIAMTEAAK